MTRRGAPPPDGAGAPAGGGAPDRPRSVRIERSGGIAGMKVGVDLKLDTLTSAQHAALAKVLKSAPARRDAPPAPDAFTYRLHVVEADGSARTVVCGEGDMPASLEALVKPSLP